MPKPKKTDAAPISQSLDKLEAIIRWFDEQSEVQVEDGLKKVREGAELIKGLRARLKEAENEFVELKSEVADALKS